MNNVLIHSRSPYLQQHAHNPVHWQIWSDKAFELAQRNNKPVLISIGYATCHWCHVMERESFSQLPIADYMNEHFVCIKVDREEHPEVDQFYMDALQTMTGMGGWPLNVFVTPDRKPFYGGTYFPPSSQYGRMGWMDLLERIQYNWIENKENIVLQGDQLVRHLNNATKVETFVFDFDKIDVDRVNSIVLQHADVMFGGFGNAPKFPNFSVLKWLLFSAQIKADKEVETLLAISIKALVNKGIYDHVEGGIARYTTDREWNVPHFEKMLYDNAQLLQVLTDYYAISKDGLIRGKITQTVRFFIDVFFQKGLFGSALNAESGGVEGAYYTFTGDELERSEFTTNTIFQSYYNLKKRGNWEGTNIPYVTGEREEFLVNNNLKLDEFNLLIDKGLNALMGIKKERIKPLYDFKKQLSWNAMMHIGLIKVQQVEQDVALVDILKLHMHTMQSQFLDEGQHLQHIVYDDGQSIQAQLDDYAYFIQSLLLHRELTSDDASLILAKRLMEQSILYFGDGEDVYFYYTKSDNSEVLVRKINILDTDYEAANAIMAYNLYLLGIIFEENSWIYRAELMVQRVLNSAVKHPLSLSSWLKLGIQFKQKFKILSHSNKDFKHSLIKVDFPYLAYFVEKESEEIPVFAQTLFKKENKYIACDKDSCVEVLVLEE